MVRPLRPAALLVPGHPGQASATRLIREAETGERPRHDYVEVARRLEADIIDYPYMTERASRLGRAVTRRAGLPAGQICEAFLGRRRYRVVCAWSDRLGLPLALLYKLARAKNRLVLLSVSLSPAKKAVFLRRLRVHSHLQAIVAYSTVQREIASGRLRVPASKLHVARHGVDTEFWRPSEGAEENMVCSAGWEERDYSTLVKAVRDLDVTVEVAVGTIVFTADEATTAAGGAPDPTDPLATFRPLRGTQGYRSIERWVASLGSEGLPRNVALRQQLGPRALRDLYARSKFVVVPLHDVDFDAGATVIVEAMAMAKAVVVTGARGQVDLLRDGEHGLYVPPGDSAALRDAIQYLLDHPEEARRMGLAGRAYAERELNMERFADELAALFRGV